MNATNEFLGNNERYARDFAKGALPMPPAKRIAVVACMDARPESGALLGSMEGEAHVIRNAGGVVTNDVIRSLTISQRLLANTTKISSITSARSWLSLASVEYSI